jgi:hypothetical protein
MKRTSLLAALVVLMSGCTDYGTGLTAPELLLPTNVTPAVEFTDDQSTSDTEDATGRGQVGTGIG